MSANSRKVSPLAWVPTLYFAMGLPFIIVNMVATLMFRGLGIDDARITLWTSLIILPWSLKPFWSPLMEMFRTKKFWVVTTQLVSGLGLALVAMSLPFPNFFPYVIALMTVVAFSGATHDIATDGVYITELSKDLQAKFIGWQGAFYNIAKVFAMGGLVYLAGALKDHVGIVQAWMVVMGLCGGILFLLGLYHIRMLPSGGIATAHADSFGGAMRETKRIFLEFFKKKYIWIYFAFILFYRFAEGLVIKIVPLFLNAPLDQQGMGLTEQQIGLYYGTFGVIAFVVGSITGRLFHFVAQTAACLVPAGLHLQRSVRGLCAAGMVSAFESRVDLCSHRVRIFQLRIWLRGAYTLYYAAGGAWFAPDGSLCFRVVACQPWRDASGYDQRLALRQLGRLSLLLHVGAAGHGSRLPACRAHSLHLSRY